MSGPRLVASRREQPGESKEVKSTLNLEGSYEDIMGTMLDDLQYVGFSPSKLRETIANVAEANPKEIVALVSAYVQIGNNPENSTNIKRKKPTKIVRSLLDKYNTTLARLAISFMPVTLIVRRLARDRKYLNDQFPTVRLDPMLKDPALSGYVGEEALPFMLEFDIALSRTGGPNNHGRENVLRWLNISMRGFKADEEIHHLMRNDIDSRSVFSWLESKFQK